MTLSRNKAKPGECVLSCWEAPSAAVRVQGTPWGLFHFSASHSSAGLESGQAAPAVAKDTAEVVDAGAVRVPHGVGLVYSPLVFFFPWRQVKQQCRSHSVAEGWRGLEKGCFACYFLMAEGESTHFSAGGFDFITSLLLWCGLAWP